MLTLKTLVEIGASAERVWQVLTHFTEYPKWNPYLRGVIGSAEVGKQIVVRRRLPKRQAQVYAARIVKAMPAVELRWRRDIFMRGLFDREQTFIVVPNGVHGVTFIQREDFSGLLAPLIVPFITKRTLAGIERMNVALKKIAESKKH
ncbi:MAG: SRPBCC domain-containing protein [Gammaproteobacteria bacterium]|nr:SRPBCC domain-containing protein [Gammaproteobacteria bacterium]